MKRLMAEGQITVSKIEHMPPSPMPISFADDDLATFAREASKPIPYGW